MTLWILLGIGAFVLLALVLIALLWIAPLIDEDGTVPRYVSGAKGERYRVPRR